jgi:glutathione S-transferase
MLVCPLARRKGVFRVPQYELISHELCPYVQRAAIALAEKGVPFTRTNVDLENKPDWFLAMSPLGKVPLLKVTDAAGAVHVLFESAVICEYLEDVLPNPLHPADPLERAQHRAWMEFGSAVLGDNWAFFTAKDDEKAARAATALKAKFTRLEEALGEGPYFGGRTVTLVDAVFGPVLRYFEVYDRLGPTGLLDGFPKVMRWRIALLQRPSVKNAVAADYADKVLANLKRQESHLLRRAKAA